MDLEAAQLAVLGNPYATGAAERAQGEAALRRVPLAQRVDTQLRRQDPAGALSLVVAVAQARAAAGDAPLPSQLLPASRYASLRHSHATIVALVEAATRCRNVLDTLVGSSEAMHTLRRTVWASCFGESLLRALEIEHVIHDHDVLLLGETGTGKETVARAVAQAKRAGAPGEVAPFGAVNAAALPETLIESTLFGHVRGAFTGALSDRSGQLRAAHGGCFFLDEVGELPPSTQAKLLRVMETNEVTPIGADRSFPADVRYVAATHKDLGAMVEQGGFRQDLFQRLAGRVIRLPPLRERAEDIPAIGLAFVRSYFPGSEPPADTLERTEAFLRGRAAQRHSWPGNVRELQNLLRDVLFGLPPTLGDSTQAATTQADAALPDGLVEGHLPLHRVEQWYMQRVFERARGNQAAAARALGIDRSTLRRRLGL